MDAWTVLGVSGKTADGLMALRVGHMYWHRWKGFLWLNSHGGQKLRMDGLKTIGAIRGRIEMGRR